VDATTELARCLPSRARLGMFWLLSAAGDDIWFPYNDDHDVERRAAIEIVT